MLCIALFSLVARLAVAAQVNNNNWQQNWRTRLATINKQQIKITNNRHTHARTQTDTHPHTHIHANAHTQLQCRSVNVITRTMRPPMILSRWSIWYVRIRRSTTTNCSRIKGDVRTYSAAGRRSHSKWEVSRTTTITLVYKVYSRLYPYHTWLYPQYSLGKKGRSAWVT